MKTLIDTIKKNENVQVGIFFGTAVTAFVVLGYVLIHFGTAPCFGF